MAAKRSIQRRLNLWLLGGVSLLLLVTGVTLAAVLGRQAAAEYDRTLLAQAQMLIALVDQDPEGVEFESPGDALPVFLPGPEAEYFQLWLSGDRAAGGEVLARSESLEGADLELQQSAAQTPLFGDTRLPDGRAGRRVQIRFLVALDQPDEEEGEDAALFATLTRQPAAVVVARERERLDQTLAGLYLTLLTAGLVVMSLLVLLVRFAVGRGLRPLDDVRDQASRLDADSLGVRLRPREQTVELDPMIEQFNALLTRLETAFERERRFSADVAHELRTPLAELRNLADIGGRWPEDRPLVESFFHDVCDATAQMERVVVNLLALARSERGLDVIDAAPFDLVTVLNLAWRQVARDIDTRALTFCYDGPVQLNVIGGRDQWALILTNLLNNAASHSLPDSAIKISLAVDSNDAGTLRVSVSNRAEQLMPDDLPRLFDRLWRKDAARSGGHHAGLGLSLVSAYARQLGLKVSADLDRDRDRLLTITLEGPVLPPQTSTTTLFNDDEPAALPASSY